MSRPHLIRKQALLAVPFFLTIHACDGPLPSAAESDAGVAPAAYGHSSAGHAKKLGPETCALSQNFTLQVINPYYPLTVGSYWILEGEEDGESLRLRIDITDQTELVGDVTTRVLTETEWVIDESGEPELLEVSYNYFAMRPDGTVCYFGEAVDIYEDGELVSHEGEWRADSPDNRPGVFMPGDPRPGTSFQMEFAPGVAEDEARIVGIGPTTVPAGTFFDTIRFREYNPLDEEKGYKIFAAGVGTIVDGPLRLVEYVVN
jgi:hypothetical protein